MAATRREVATRGGTLHPVAIIDTHCHLDLEAFDGDRDTVLRRARRAGVSGIVVPAVSRARWPGLLALCAAEADLYPALGLHPVYLDQHQDDDISDLEQSLSDHRVVAVGEIGLDYFVNDLDRSRQEILFESQLLVARNAGLPVIVHVRKAHDEVIQRLRQITPAGGIIHAFNGSEQQANAYIELGFKLGFGGMLTFERSRKLRRLARNLPVEALVLETDAPDMTVAQHAGERNSPEYLPYCLAALAEVRDVGAEEIAEQTNRNVRAVLKIPDTGQLGFSKNT